jgi:thiamine-phosphate pyrophosphorylase
MTTPPRDLTAMELVLISDGLGDGDRVARLVARAVSGGVRAVQLREPGMSARVLADLCRALLPVLESVGGLLLVNDRADLVAAGLAHGVHLGRRSLTPREVRRFLPETCLVGYSAHDPESLSRARAEGADYASLSPIFATVCKPGASPIGFERASTWTAAAGIPVIWLGGLSSANLDRVRDGGARGFALRSALCDAVDPAREAARLRKALDREVSGS